MGSLWFGRLFIHDGFVSGKKKEIDPVAEAKNWCLFEFSYIGMYL